MISEMYNDQMGRYFAKLAQTQTNISETVTNTAVGSFPPPQIIKTNADKIRAMSDEELAEWFLSIGLPPGATKLACHWDRRSQMKEEWLDWLKEVKHESN